MLELALNYVTISIAAMVFVALLVLLFSKRGKLLKKQKTIICCVCSIIAIYFVFVLVLVFAFGNRHPLGEPTPSSVSVTYEDALQTVEGFYPAPLIIEADGDRTITGDEVGYAFRISMPMAQGDSTEQTSHTLHIVGVVKSTGQLWEYISDTDEWIQVSTGSTSAVISENEESPKTTYHFTRYGKDGEVISIAALTDEKLAENIIMDVMVKSAAWQGVDISTLEEYYLIEQTLADTEEKSEYYAYLLDGKAVLQRGNNGMYSYLSQELYDALDGIYTNALERTDTVSP